MESLIERVDFEKLTVGALASMFAVALLRMLWLIGTRLIDRMDKLIETTSEMNDSILVHDHVDELRYNNLMSKLRGDVTPVEVPIPTVNELRQAAADKKRGLYGIRGRVARSRAPTPPPIPAQAKKQGE